ncbi:hypothetical protein [Aeromonas veronii]|uniref:hypothetical protein n=1 Tax=Aeromonas veronii TaxID=654 RepID=UPI001BCC3122|nr:hypothetical protein [Aeromonas veronii]MBS4724091.1 hypothetical protein [Aeromonas veronii]MCJ8235762.1 hypothetical protein [Aeromonas veronii]
MKPTTTQAPVAHVATPKETLTPREGTFLMMVAQLVVLTCIVLAATVGGLSWLWTLLLAIPPVIGGALLSRVWGKLPR